MNEPAAMAMTPYATPRYANVGINPTCCINHPAAGAENNDPAPNPATAIPVMSPRRSGNHFTRTVIGTMYPMPSPVPPITPYVRYSHQSPCAEKLARNTPPPHSRPAVMATTLGPTRFIHMPADHRRAPQEKPADQECRR